jgi:hypothetical protein
MKVELLYFDGCPSHARFSPRLTALIAEAGVETEVEQRRVESPQAAVAERFLGSPTVRIDGLDVEPGAERHCDSGLKCRLYSNNEGLRGTPPEELVLEALYAARSREDGDEHRTE